MVEKRKAPGLPGTEKHGFVALARCARYNRATARQGSLILTRGLFRPPLHPPGSRALPFENPATLTRGGRAYRPWAGAGAVAGASCVSGETPAARRGSWLTWAGQPARPLDGALAEALPGLEAGLAPLPSPFARPVCSAWTARLGEAHTGRGAYEKTHRPRQRQREAPGHGSAEPALYPRPGRRPPQAGRRPRPVPVRPHPQCPAKDSPPPLPPPASR